MTICLINNLYAPHVRGGAEQVVKKTVETLLAEGHRVVLITTSPHGEEVVEEGGLTIYRYRPSNLFFYTDAHHHGIMARFFWHLIDTFHIGSARLVRRILEKEKPDVVHTHNLMGMSFLIPSMIRRLGLPHIHTVHDVQLVEPSGVILKQAESSWRYRGVPTKIYTLLMKWLCGSPNVVISPSQFLLDFYTSRGFFSRSQSFVLRNPVSFPREVRRSEGARVCRFLYLGQVEAHKGVVLLLSAFLSVANECKDAVELHVVGSGALLETLKKQAAGNAQVFFHGRVDREALPDFFSLATITVVPSLCYENSPTVIFESLSYHVPVLASRIEGVVELIREGENGITFTAGDETSLRDQLGWCVKNREALREMAKKTTDSLVGLSEEAYQKELTRLYAVALGSADT